MRRALLAALVLGLGLSAGCVSTVAKQAYYGATGASARYFEMNALGGDTSLDAYTAVGVERFTTDLMGSAVPPALPEMAQQAIIKRLQEMKVFASVTAGAPAGKGLIIRGRYHDYDSGGSALRAVGFGVDPFLTAQIHVIDAQTNKVIGVAMITGTTKSAVRVGESELADGVGKAVKGLFERHHSKPPDE
jgi:hypothetical protein